MPSFVRLAAAAVVVGAVPVSAFAESRTLTPTDLAYTGKPGASTITGSSGADTIFGDPAAGSTVTTLKRVSQTKAGVGRAFPSASPNIAPDGGVVVFQTRSTDLDGQTAVSALTQILAADTATGAITVVSKSAGALGDGWSSTPRLSPDGKRVVFESAATNLAPGATNNSYSILVADRSSGTVSLVSRARDTGLDGNSDSSGPQFSPDGARIAYRSEADNLVPGDGGTLGDIFVSDPASFSSTRRVSTTADGGDAAEGSGGAKWSPDGKAIAFNTVAPNLSGSALQQVVIKTLGAVAADGDTLGAVSVVSASSAGTPGDDNSGGVAFSPDGRLAAFSSAATNLGPADGNGAFDVYLKVLKPDGIVPGAAGTVVLGSRAKDGGQGDFGSFVSGPGFTPDGQSIVFTSTATNLAPGATNGESQLLMKSLVTGDVALVSRVPGGAQGDGDSTGIAFRADGRAFVFQSKAADFPGDDTPMVEDVWYATLSAGPAGDDVIAGGGGDDRLFGASGNDRIDGGPGADWLYGGPGNDTLVTDSALDTIVEYPGEGSDTVVASYSFTLTPTLEHLVLSGSAKTGVGNGAANTITGNASANVLSGLGGKDVLSGLAGADSLSGGEGDDILVGGAGRDTLTGGPGADVFLFKRLSDSPAGTSKRDTVTDFRASQRDVIDLSAIDANTKAAGNQAFRWRGGKRFTKRAGQLRFSGGVLSGDVDGDGRADLQIRLTGVSALSSSRLKL
jgi:Ca2+-binding RTX toxin-like protein